MPPQQPLQEQGNNCRSSTLMQTKGRKAELLEEQRYWRTASNSVRIAVDLVQDTEIESAESKSPEKEIKHCH